MSNETTYLAYCNRMIRLAIPLFVETMKKHGLFASEVYQGIDFLGAPHPVGEAWLTEPLSIYAIASKSEAEDGEKVQITIRPTADWKPVLTVSGSSLDPIPFETTCSAEKDLAVIWETIEGCFARIKAG